MSGVNRIGDELVGNVKVRDALFFQWSRGIERTVVGSKRLRTLTGVMRSGSGVIDLELQTVGQAAIQLRDERIVTARDDAANLGHLRKQRVRPVAGE